MREPLCTVLPGWVDHYRHMNLAYYLVAFDIATDALWPSLGLGPGFRERGLGTFAATLEGKVKHLSYKTMRYPGHNSILKLLLWDLGFREHRDELKVAFERALPTTRQDIVAIFVSATGQVDGRFTERTYAKIVRHKEIGGHHWTAIQVTTACGVTAMLDLLRDGKLPQSGFVRNEDASFGDFIPNRFGRHYA